MKGNYYLPKSILVIDGTLREGIQNEELFIPTETKLFLIEGLIDAGFKCLELGSISPADAVPQFRDTEEILRRIARKSGVLYKCNAFTMRLLERAVRLKKEGYGPDIINVQFATTDEFSQDFFRKNVSERLKYVEDAVKIAHDAGLIIQVTIINTWYCPYKGELPSELALQTTDQFIKIGCDIVRFGDTFGDATPNKLYEHFSRLLDKYPEPNQFTLHYHDYRGFGLANYLAALQAGCIRFDTTLGGIGGPPAGIVGGIHARGAVEYRLQTGRKGLVSTEDFITMCDAMGVETGINVDKVIVLGKWMERILGRELWSFCLSSGKVPKGSEIAKGRQQEIA
jgi:hydroxymethylglutaryl-CoA lyase